MLEIIGMLSYIFSILLFAFGIAIVIRLYQALTIYVMKNHQYLQTPFYIWFMSKINHQEHNVDDESENN